MTSHLKVFLSISIRKYVIIIHIWKQTDSKVFSILSTYSSLSLSLYVSPAFSLSLSWALALLLLLLCLPTHTKFKQMAKLNLKIIEKLFTVALANGNYNSNNNNYSNNNSNNKNNKKSQQQHQQQEEVTTITIMQQKWNYFEWNKSVRMYKTPPAHCGEHFRESRIFPGYRNPCCMKREESWREGGAQLAVLGGSGISFIAKRVCCSI